MNTEKDLQNYIRKQCKLNNILCYKFASPAKRGVPDLLLVGTQGTVYFVELKSPAGTGSLSKLQKREIAILTAHNANVQVIKCKEGADALIEKIAYYG